MSCMEMKNSLRIISGEHHHSLSLNCYFKEILSNEIELTQRQYECENNPKFVAL